MENFKYQDESDMPRDTYIGLKMQIGLAEKSIRYTKINLNKAKYSYEKKRYEKRLEYLTNLLNIYKDELNKFDKNEGIHLVAYVKDKQTGEATTIEDNDYNSKQDFENDLKANGYNNISILDNRDLYLLDNTNYTRVSQLKKDLQQLKKDIDDAKDKYPALYKSYVKEYDRLKTIYDNVMKVSLTEGYVLKGIQDGKSFDISYNENENKLQKLKDELQPSHKNVDMYIVKENKKIKPGNMKKLNIGGDGIVYKVSMQDAVKLQNAGYEIFLPQRSRKSLYARLGDIEDYNNGYDVYDNKLEEDKNNSIILYHGSPNKNITSLQIGVKDTTGDQYGRGIYLTSDYNEAEGYAGSDGKVYKVQLDSNINLYNMKDKLSDSIKEQVKKELSNSDNKDVKNYLVMFGRKVYKVTDKQEGLKFFKEKEQEWKNKDNKYFGNKPKVSRTDKELEVIYTDYNDMDNAINNMTGDNLLDVFSGDVNPEVFATIIKDSGYDGVISLSGKWYVIYKNIDKVHILNENKKLKNKNKLEEVSRNELLVKTKGETIDRYNKAAGYRGFSIYNIDTSNILRYNSLVVICRVGKYNTAVELEEILYWIQIVAENTKSYTKNQINTKVVTQAIMNSIDGLNIRVDCECGDWKYRMAYQATQWGYKYGTPENRPANIRNPEGRGALCKHLTSILGNKRWLQQVTSTLLNWLEANIDEVNRFLGLSGDRVLTLPNELARQNAKLSWQNRRKGDSDDDTTNQDNSENNENQDNNTNNVQGNNPSTNAINNAGSVEEQTDETEQEDNEG